jgi:cytochrome c oxidase assembly protein subunit 15
MNADASHEKQTPIIFWLLIVVVMIFITLMVGGITRLTDSGLSMVDWRPLMGIFPPSGDAEWNEVFDMYKEYPEYQQLNSQMTLSEFKMIFFWEYMHRILGRLIGLIFLLPWIYFNIKKRLTREFNLKLLGLFILLGLQGLLGWYMVQSGLIGVPHVSHYRLAAHLLLALSLLGATLWQLLNLVRGDSVRATPSLGRLRQLALGFTALVLLQIFYGAMVAGLDAGLGYKTFPLMAGRLVPHHMFILDPALINLLDNPVTVHFLHRTFGWLLVFSAIGIWIYTRKLALDAKQSHSINVIGGMVIVQFILGIFTVLHSIPVGLAVTHQVVAAAIFASAISLNHSLRK